MKAGGSFALQKLLVSQLWRGSAANRAKWPKDLAQAGILTQVLAQDRPFRLAETWRELLGRGPAWRQLARKAVDALPDDFRGVLEDPGRSSATTRDGPEKAQSDREVANIAVLVTSLRNTNRKLRPE